ncbi:hypothetical protein XAC908_1150001 [Xanthomonas citri pv. citri]|nr:hypothetical protein XAC908_1150001 [Xanthomonas citri pv. citri]
MVRKHGTGGLRGVFQGRRITHHQRQGRHLLPRGAGLHTSARTTASGRHLGADLNALRSDYRPANKCAKGGAPAACGMPATRPLAPHCRMERRWQPDASNKRRRTPCSAPQ